MIALDLLAALRAQHTTGPAIAAALGITKQAVSLLEKGGKMGEETATKAATLLGLDACIVLAQLRADYADSDTTKAVWLEVVRRLSTSAATPAPGNDGPITEPIFIMSSFGRAVRSHQRWQNSRHSRLFCTKRQYVKDLRQSLRGIWQPASLANRIRAPDGRRRNAVLLVLPQTSDHQSSDGSDTARRCGLLHT